MRQENSAGISHNITRCGTFEEGENLKVSIKIPFSFGWLERVTLVVQTSEEKNLYQMNYIKNEDDYSYFEVDIGLKTYAIYYYYFSFEANNKLYYYTKNELTTDPIIFTSENCFKLSSGFYAPDWAKGANMYHIFVDRFKRSENKEFIPMRRRTIHKDWFEPPVIGPNMERLWNIDFYGGDLRGIIDALPYIKTLNTDIIYLSPICKSQSNHRYDTGDYEVVDPYAGTNEDLKDLCEEAHKLGMKVILDAVFNHTGNDSKYFNELRSYDSLGAFQSKDSPYYDFYKRKWFQGEYDFSYWWGMKNLPECDSGSKHWRDYICSEGGIIDKWFNLGIDGLRLDVADELSDEFIEEIADAAKRNKPDSFILGEVWKNPMRMNRDYISSGKHMHSVMNYLLMDALIRYYKYIDVSKLEDIIKEIMSEYPDDTILTLMNFTSTHDISRAIEIFGTNLFQQNGEWAWNLGDDSLQTIKSHHMTEKEYYYGKMTLMSFIVVLAFLPGIFSIFYGDEVGLQGIGNLANRATFPWGKEDNELLDFFRKIRQVRHDETFLKTAEFKVVEITPEYFCFERYNENNRIIVIASRSHHVVNLDKKYRDYELIYSLNCCSKNILSPYGALVFRI